MVAGVLSACGAWCGSTVPGDETNPKGFFEHTIIREQIVKPMLTQIGADTSGVVSLPPLKLNMTVPKLDQYLGDIIAGDGYDGQQPWLYKDAKLSLLWPAFDAAFPEACWIIVRRNVDRVIDSCLNTPFMKQHSVDRAFWHQFATAYQERLDALNKTVKHSVTLDVESIFQGDSRPLKTILPQCGLRHDQLAIDLLVDRRHWHYPDKP